MTGQDIRFNIPNIISFCRLVSAPIAVWLILNQIYAAAFWIFVSACVSDAADGYIAKKFNLQTELGRFLDPIADKALLISVFVTLGQVDLIDTWLVILVVFRDALILCGAILYHLLYGSLTMQPLLISKINTTAQFILAAMVMGMSAFGLINESGIIILTYFVAGTTFASGASYVMTWGRKAMAMELGE